MQFNPIDNVKVGPLVCTCNPSCSYVDLSKMHTVSMPNLTCIQNMISTTECKKTRKPNYKMFTLFSIYIIICCIFSTFVFAHLFYNSYMNFVIYLSLFLFHVCLSIVLCFLLYQKFKKTKMGVKQIALVILGSITVVHAVVIVVTKLLVRLVKVNHE